MLDGRTLANDGVAFGNLKVRGPWIASGYFRSDDDAAHAEPGWFETGDVATIDADGFMHIVDRSKDVIKSGGEWISSIELENLAVAHSGGARGRSDRLSRRALGRAAAPGDRVEVRDGTVDRRPAGAFLERHLARWSIPDDVVVVDELLHTATGKLQKLEPAAALRRRSRGRSFAPVVQTRAPAPPTRHQHPCNARHRSGPDITTISGRSPAFMSNAVIVGYARSLFTPAHKRRTRPASGRTIFAAQVVRGLLDCTGVDPEAIEDLILGCAFPEGEQGFNVRA